MPGSMRERSLVPAARGLACERMPVNRMFPRLSTFLLVVSLAAQSVKAEPSPSGASSRPSFESVAANARKSVVVVACHTQKDRGQFGSGFAVGRAGLFATNAHVVENCTDTTVTEYGSAESKPAFVLMQDTEKDIALLYAPGISLPLLATVSLKGVAVGSRVLAVGHPEGLEFSVSDGIVSAIRELSPGIRMIQVTAPISPGSSGGPLLDIDGRVVGMATLFVKEGQNLNFAVPAEEIKKAIDALSDGGRNGRKATQSQAQDTASTASAELIGRIRKNLSAKNYTLARTLVIEGLSKYPNDLPMLLEAAELAWDKDAPEMSQELVDRMLVINPDYAYAHKFKGAIFMNAGNFDDAEREFERALELGMNREYTATTHSFLCNICIKRGDWAKALLHADEAIKDDSTASKADFRANRAKVLLRVGRKSEASREAELALSLSRDVRELLARDGLPFGLRIVSDASEWDAAHNAIVKGVVINDSDHVISLKRVVAVCLDASGTALATGFGFTNPEDLPAGMTGSFKIYLEGSPERCSSFRARIVDE